jgi:ATP-grasp domain
MAAGKRVLILNRWSDETFTRFAEYIDHRKHSVTYITTARAERVVPADEAAGVYVLDNLDDAATVTESARRAARAAGGIDVVIGLAEADLELAAHVRQELGVAGNTPRIARLHRDKVEMKRRLAEVGVRTPRFINCESEPQVVAFARAVGLPVMLKPRKGLASRGACKIESERHLLETLREIDLHDYECEEFVKGEVLHADGLVWRGAVALFKPFKYLNSCYDFAVGKPVGCVTLDDAPLAARMRTFTEHVLRGLEHANGAFHLEFFRDNDDNLVFCELGARIGGAEIPYLFRDVFGVVLARECTRIELGEWDPAEVVERPAIAGGLLLPPPPNAPCRVARCELRGGGLPTLYAATLRRPGDTVDAAGGYNASSISGMLLFNGQSTAEVERDIVAAVEQFEIDSVAIDAGATTMTTRWSWQPGVSSALAWS